MSFLKEFFVFGWMQVQACIFAGSFFVLLALSHVLPLGGLPRYDFLFLGSLALQGFLLWRKWETWDEVKTIALFHVIGLLLELYKTSPAIGSWSYPEEGVFVLLWVPLYSGFMYAAVGSYIAQAWRLFQLRITGAPPAWLGWVLGVLIYVNFFAHHFLPDVRWWLAVAVVVVFWRTRVHFMVLRPYRMPLVLSFVLIAFFIWVAENIATFLGAWQYPNQQEAWHLVGFSKISSWALLVILSILLVWRLKELKEHHYARTERRD